MDRFRHFIMYVFCILNCLDISRKGYTEYQYIPALHFCFVLCLRFELMAFSIPSWLQWKSDRKSYVAGRMPSLPMPLNNLEGHFAV